MLPRFLVVSWYEVRKYRGSIVDEAVILLVILAAFLMLITPEVRQTSLPSSYKIYRVGYPEGSVLERLDSYTLQFLPFWDNYEMISASSLNQIDGFALFSGGKIVAFGSGTMKSYAALSHLNTLLSEFNTERVFAYINSDRNLSGVLLPVRLQVFEEDINYSKAVSGSVELERRQIFGVRQPTPPQAEATRPLDTAGLNVSSSESAPKYNRVLDEIPGSAGKTAYGNVTLPVELTVEFPFKALYKNMTLLSPLMLLSILLALSLSKERVDRTVENLFNSPLSNYQILLGKSLPYIIMMGLLSLLYGFYTSQTLEALKAASVFMALSVTMLSFSLFSVLISRSYRELTFIGSFSMFAFFLFIVLPNVFSGVNVLAFISPLDMVTAIENGASIPPSELIMSLLPYGFLTMFFLSFTGVCFNAEVVSSSPGFGSLLGLFYSTLSRELRSKVMYVSASVSLLVPFIFIVESILAYLVLPLGWLAPVTSLFLLAAIEELVKIAPFCYRRMNPVVYGVLAGASFFLTEKLFNLYLISKVYSYLGGPYVLFLTKMAPTLVLHVVSTTLFAGILYKTRSRILFALALLLSVTLHVIYNILAIRGML